MTLAGDRVTPASVVNYNFVPIGRRPKRIPAPPSLGISAKTSPENCHTCRSDSPTSPLPRC